jgi:hypothetical protein
MIHKVLMYVHFHLIYFTIIYYLILFHFRYTSFNTKTVLDLCER